MNKLLSKENIFGIIPPMVSPFDDRGVLDLVRFRSELRFMEQTGITLVVIGGSTGSGDELTPQELASLVRTATVEARMRVIAGVLTTTTRDAVHRGRLAAEAGASALMVGPPIYTAASDDGIIRYITDVANETGLPIVYYNHSALPASILRRVAALPGVICIKENLFEPVSELVQTVGAEVAVAAGVDAVNIASFLVGAAASIAGINTVIPRQYLDIYDAYRKGDFAEAVRMTEKIAPLAREMIKPVNFPARVRFAINLLGRDVGEPLRPSGNLPQEDRDNILAALRHAGLVA